MVKSNAPTHCDHVRAWGMHDLWDVATELHFLKVNPITATTVTFTAQCYATPPSYFPNHPVIPIWLPFLHICPTLGLLEVLPNGLSKLSIQHREPLAH